jgi:hypothetical protein
MRLDECFNIWVGWPLAVRRSAEFKTFDNLVGRVLSVSHEEIKRREAEYKKRADVNPHKRGPKGKVRPSALPSAPQG